MKKFAKLVAVFAALMLAWACFVACSDGDDDSGSNSGSNSGTNSGSNSGTNSGSNSGTNSGSVKALQGLWIDKDGYGYYFDGNIYYQVKKDDGKYYYNDEYGDKFSVSGNKLTMYWYDEEDKKHYEDEWEFAIDGGTLTIRFEYNDGEDGSLISETVIYKKVAGKPVPYEESDDEE